jgi:hypothetical protein
MIDVCYYSRLLRGAVNALLNIEKENRGLIYLSTEVEKLFGALNEKELRLNWQVYLFYVPVFVFLLVATGIATSISICRALH